MTTWLLLIAYLFGILTSDLIKWIERFLRRPRLHLTIEGLMAINPGQTATARIAPTPVGSTVSNVVYTASDASWTIVPAADGLSAVYTAGAIGAGFTATVTAVATDGTALTDSKPLPDVVAPPATALNLTITTP